ncbi:MAG: PH domain-containing protein [Alphaproteobacteria bacterium]|nr:PH domain-containing protein [Alphaproteobacteria bacterium]
MSSETTKPGSAEKQKNKASLIEERLLEGEQVVATAFISDGIFWKAGAVFVLALLFAFLVAVELGILLAVVSVVMAAYYIALKEILMLVVTNKRILFRYGILQIDIVDIHFDKVESVELERMLPGYMLGYSNVVVMGTGNRYIVIPYVANGVEIRRAFNELTLNKEKK